MQKRSYTIVGVGAVGGYYGARLAAAGHPVSWVARSDAAHLSTHGLKVSSPKGDLTLSDLTVAGPDDPVPAADVVVLCTKTHNNSEMAQRIVPAVGPGTSVVVLQNGLDVERPLAEALPGTTVLGAMSFICAQKPGPGQVDHLDYEKVTIGQYSRYGRESGVTQAVTEVVDDLSAAGIPTEALPDLLVGRWRKLAWNIPFNGLAVVLGASTAEMVANPDSRALAVTMMEEVVAASAALGHPVGDDTPGQMIRSTEKMIPYAPSMRLDYEAGRRLELASIYETPLRTAAGGGASMPATESLWRMLRYLSAD